jgi:Mycobacterium membrane protein
MGKAYGAAHGRLINLSAIHDYDQSLNAHGLEYDAVEGGALLVFPAAEFPERNNPVTQYAPPPPQQQAKPSNGLGTTGFVLGLVGLVLSFIPLIGVVAWPLVILGIIFSAVGISKAAKGRATNKGMAITGLVVSVVGLVICVLWAVVWNAASDAVEEEANREAVIVYEVSGDAPAADVSYSVFSDADSTTKDEHVTTLPWTKEVKAKGVIKEGQVIVTAGEQGGTVTCKLTVDGKEVDTNTATGPFAVATCDSL